MYAIAAMSVIGSTIVTAYLVTPRELRTALDAAANAPPPAAQAPPPPAAGASGAAAGARGAAAIDLSKMTPREAADRLFNRVMRANERGDSAEATRFAPMAIAAYARVSDLDLDAHFHLGLLHLVLGDVDAARREIDTLKAADPHHLLALVLEHQIAKRAGDQAAIARIEHEFAAAYPAEIAKKRPEYAEHRAVIDRLHEAIAKK